MWGNTESFSDWAERTHQQLIAREPATVPCGTCTACCRAGQFIHVDAREAAAEVIPAEYLVPAPGAPGQLLLGHLPNGACPMLIHEQCSIYADRPLACRTYDCRIFAAADVYPDGPQQEIAERARTWSFKYRDDSDRAYHQAVKNAARFLDHHSQTLFGGPVNEIQISLAALKLRKLFNQQAERTQSDYDPAGEPTDFIERAKAVLQP